jgi:predicted nucleic acid-binding Zn ribbon protein
MARTDTYRGVSMNCVVCSNPIPKDRKADAVTCGPDCTKARKNWLRSRKDQTECRYCLRPSTPEERTRFMAWRRWEEAGMSNEESLASLLHRVERLQRKLAEYENIGNGSHTPQQEDNITDATPFPYVLHWRIMDRKGQRCRVDRQGVKTYLIEFEDGFKTLVDKKAIRRIDNGEATENTAEGNGA